MTKTENRAAAKAFHREQDRQRREESQAEATAADLEELRKLRDYLIFKARSGVPAQALIAAIDDHVEKLTGDRTALHAKSSSIG